MTSWFICRSSFMLWHQYTMENKRYECKFLNGSYGFLNVPSVFIRSSNFDFSFLERLRISPPARTGIMLLQIDFINFVQSHNIRTMDFHKPVVQLRCAMSFKLPRNSILWFFPCRMTWCAFGEVSKKQISSTGTLRREFPALNVKY